MFFEPLAVFLLPMKGAWMLLLLGGVVYMMSCTKEQFSTDPSLRLYTSVDTLHFDTVFTTTGSTSQFIKVINNNASGIMIDEVRLAGGASSRFRINVDGLPGPLVRNVEVAANDSAYIYVVVNIEPGADSLPFLVRDSIFIKYNGNTDQVQLDAFGQNANFLRNGVIATNTTWQSKLPYVLLGPLVVNPGVTLTINAGTRVFLHADAPLVVHGSLEVNGGRDVDERVLFTGDRLDLPYRDFPASFPGLVFTEASNNNRITYATIRNAYQGIVAAGHNGVSPKIIIRESIIENAFEQGIWGLNTSIHARNLLVSNCGQNVLLFGGGDYNFTHTTLAAYSTPYLPHKKRVLTVTDFYAQGNVVTTAPLKATFTNCIFWGENNGIVEDEVWVEKKGAQTRTVNFDRVLWRMKNQLPSAIVNITGTPINQDPRFDSINTSKRIFNFRLKPGSPAIDAGVNAGVLLDLDGLGRPKGAAPDLGAYERQ